MKAVVTFVDFHWDNHQGGSGKSFEFSLSLDIPDRQTADQFWDFVHGRLAEKVQRERPFKQDNKYSIQYVEIV
jgi:hypothetical protein